MKRGSEKMEAAVEERVKEDVEKYWERPFVVNESIQQIRLFESKKLEAKVKCGLELWRAKLHFRNIGRDKEGKCAWYPYLLACGISQPTSSRRKKLAEYFLQWAGILVPDDIVLNGHIIKGLELIHQNLFILNDFWQHLFDKNKNSIEASLQPPKSSALYKQAGSIFGVSPSIIFNKVRYNIDDRYTGWSFVEKQEARDTLKQIIRFCQNELKHMDELDKLSAKEQIKNRRFAILQAEPSDKEEVSHVPA
jgi:hypothetical protein